MVKEKEKTKKITKKKNNVVVKENTTTPILPTTRYYIKSWGYYNKNIIIEQINPNNFLYNLNGLKGIVEVKTFKEFNPEINKVEEIGKGFIIEDILYLFKKRIYTASTFYNVPSLDLCNKYLAGEFKVRKYEEIEKDIQNILKEMFDFSSELDIKTSSLTISQSWIKPLLNEFFFYGIDSTKGGGKTTLGEIVYFLIRHGFIGGDISSASIPRLVDELDLNVFIDEIDQNKDDDAVSILRKGQRRGNPYVRCEGRDNRPVPYNLAGIHGFSFRSELEDAFMDRSLRIHTSKSKDYMLPVINSIKKDILKPLADELFFWFMDNILVVSCSQHRAVVGTSNPTHIFKKNLFTRTNLFNFATLGLSTGEIQYLKKVFGRDNELTFLCLKTSKFLGLDLLEDVKKIIDRKKADESTSEGFYLESLKEYIAKEKSKIFMYHLKDGFNAGNRFYPKNRLYQGFVQYLKELNIMGIGTKKYNSYLRDIGFVEGINISSQRYPELNYPTACLIFDENICKNIGLNYEKQESLKIEEEKIKEKPKIDISNQEAKELLEGFE